MRSLSRWQGDRKGNVKYHLTVEYNSPIILTPIACKNRHQFKQLPAKLFDHFEWSLVEQPNHAFKTVVG
jgi:hypothetical protein